MFVVNQFVNISSIVKKKYIKIWRKFRLYFLPDIFGIYLVNIQVYQ